MTLFKLKIMFNSTKGNSMQKKFKAIFKTIWPNVCHLLILCYFKTFLVFVDQNASNILKLDIFKNFDQDCD